MPSRNAVDFLFASLSSKALVTRKPVLCLPGLFRSGTVCRGAPDFGTRRTEGGLTLAVSHD
jgi:hypothetical protein